MDLGTHPSVRILPVFEPGGYVLDRLPRRRARSEQAPDTLLGQRFGVVLWSGDPFSVYALADLVWIDGALRYDRLDPEPPRVSDFELGLVEKGGSR